MIQRQTVTLRNIPRTTTRHDRGTLRFGEYWQRLSQGWSRAWSSPSSLERRIDSEVRFQLRRQPEPGDAMIVNRIVEDMSR
jgi:hypothetical protein